MSWLYTMFFAGLIFSSSEGNLQNTTQYSVNYNETNATNIVKLDETEKFEQTYPLNANGRVSVGNVNGSITIETWDNNQVKLEVTKIADTKERLSEVEVKIDSRPELFNVETDYSSQRDGNSWRNGGKSEVQYRLTVPKNAVLNEIETVNGSINITNAQNMTKASAVNGTVRATNLRGNANLSTVNGTVEADFSELQSGSKISLNTVNGTVNLMIPSDSNATLRADSVNGNITNDFGLPVRKGKYVGRDMYGKVGTGEVQIRLNSVNGALSVKRKQDGKNVNPATNLLPQKSEDDEDWDEDDNISVNKMNKEIKNVEKEMKAAEKDIAAAVIDTQRINTEINTQINSAIAVVPRISEEALKEMEVKQREFQIKLAEMDFTRGSSSVERKNGSFVVKDKPKVKIDADNCIVNVRGWDKSEVSYTVTKISRSRSQQALEVKTQNTESSVEIKVLVPEMEDLPNNLNRVVVEVFVPKKSNLRVVTNREIRLEGVSGEIDLIGADSNVNVRDSEGKLSVQTSEGKIRVIGFKGEIISRTECGEMDLEGDFQKISAQTEEGKIVLTLPDNTNAIFNSDVEIESEGFKLVREDEDEMRWKIGNGNAQYNLVAANGQVFVRNAKILKAN